MNDTTYLLEICLYSLVNFLPCFLFTIEPFRDRLRCTRTALWAGIAINYLFHTAMIILKIHTQYNAIVSLLCSSVHALFLIRWVRDHWGKSLFILLIMTNISNFIVVLSKCLEGILFPFNANELYHWTLSVTTMIANAVVLIPLHFYFKNIYPRAILQDTSTTAWRCLWLIPLTFYSVWFRNFYFSQEGALALTLRPRHVLFSLVINCGALLTYTMVAQLISEHSENQALRERKHQLTMQQAQYDNLQDRIYEARRAKHDLRQHLHIVAACIKDEKYAELEEYVNRFRSKYPDDDSTLSFCDNYAVNALLQYFSGCARQNGTGFSAIVQLPNDAGIPDDVLTVVLGNLLENATEACSNLEGAVLSVRGKRDDSAIFFKIVNTCPIQPKLSKDGYYLSGKRKGTGIGLRSVENITQQYGGMMKAHWEDGTFTVSVLLNIQDT